MMNLLQCVSAAIIAVISATVSGDEIYGDRFSKNDLNSYLKNTGKQIKFETDATHGKMIVSGMDFTMKEISMRPRTKYRLSFIASRTGGVSFESQLMDTITLFPQRGAKYPALRLRFSDAAGKTVPHDNPALTIYSTAPEHYACLFYAPSGTERFSASFDVPNGIVLKLADLRLEEEKAEKSLNVNGDFALGLYNYSGIASANDDSLRIIKDEQKKNCFFTGFYACTTRCPVEPGKKYVLTLAGTGYNRNRVDSFLLFWRDSDWKKPLMQIALPRLTKENGGRSVYRFTAPPDARWMSLWIYHATMSEIRIAEEK